MGPEHTPLDVINFCFLERRKDKAEKLWFYAI